VEFLKKHYEKIILSVVLLGLAGVAATLPLKVKQGKEREEERNASLIGAKVTPYPAVDLSTNRTVLQKVKSPIRFDIAGKHNLFNPVPWMRLPNGEVIKVKTGDEVGIGALKITAINPLQMIVSLEDILPTTGANGQTDYKYQITIIREGAPPGTAKQSRAMAPGATANNFATLKEIQGAPDNPTAVVVLPDRTQVSVSKDKPYSKIIGYSADLLYDLTNPPTVRKGAKVGDPIPFGNETYKITSIDKDTVVFRANSNQKQTKKSVASLP